MSSSMNIVKVARMSGFVGRQCLQMCECAQALTSNAITILQVILWCYTVAAPSLPVHQSYTSASWKLREVVVRRAQCALISGEVRASRCWNALTIVRVLLTSSTVSLCCNLFRRLSSCRSLVALVGAIIFMSSATLWNCALCWHVLMSAGLNRRSCCDREMEGSAGSLATESVVTKAFPVCRLKAVLSIGLPLDAGLHSVVSCDWVIVLLCFPAWTNQPLYSLIVLPLRIYWLTHCCITGEKAFLGEYKIQIQIWSD